METKLNTELIPSEIEIKTELTNSNTFDDYSTCYINIINSNLSNDYNGFPIESKILNDIESLDLLLNMSLKMDFIVRVNDNIINPYELLLNTYNEFKIYLNEYMNNNSYFKLTSYKTETNIIILVIEIIEV